MQPLNETYKNEILEVYRKISDTFDDFTELMRRRVPYESWPSHCKIDGVNIGDKTSACKCTEAPSLSRWQAY